MTSNSRSNRMIIQTKYRDQSSKYSFPFSKRGSKILDLAVTRRDSIARLKRNARGCRRGYYRVRDEWSWFLLPTFEFAFELIFSSSVESTLHKGLKLPFLLRLIQQNTASQDIFFTIFWHSTLNGRSVWRWLIRLAEGRGRKCSSCGGFERMSSYSFKSVRRPMRN